MSLLATTPLKLTCLSILIGVGAFFYPAGLLAQEARPADVATPEAIVRASYEALIRKPGELFDWDRFRTLHLPGSLMIPNTEQRGGQFSVLSVEDFIQYLTDQ